MSEPSNTHDDRQYFATAAKGTEVALRDELRRLRFREVRADRGGVHFSGRPREGYRACIELRCAVRVLEELGSFDAPDGDALYEGARKIDWSRFVDERGTLAVRSASKASEVSHTQFIAQRTKDAIVDQIRERKGARPNVDLEDPDLGVFVRLAKDEATVYADLSGRALHTRGYRKLQGAASLKETLAASLVALSGYDTSQPFADPMCGSGTVAIEAALMAYDVAPGSLGAGFGFERWVSYGEAERATARDLLRAARDRKKSTGPDILASDVDPKAVEMAVANAKRAGVPIRCEVQDAAALDRTRPAGWVVTNPPYGERLALDRVAFERIGKTFAALAGSTVGVLAGGPDLLDAIPMRSSKSIAVWNGDLECRLALYQPGSSSTGRMTRARR